MYHRGVYRGFGNVRPLPDVYGLREMWETPSIGLERFYPHNEEHFDVMVETKTMSLWYACPILYGVVSHKTWPTTCNTRC
jgi:hypothetical protein